MTTSKYFTPESLFRNSKLIGSAGFFIGSWLLLIGTLYCIPLRMGNEIATSLAPYALS